MDNLLLLFAMGGVPHVKLRRIKNGKNQGKVLATMPLRDDTKAEIMFNSGSTEDTNRAIRILRYAKWTHRIDRWLSWMPLASWSRYLLANRIVGLFSRK